MADEKTEQPSRLKRAAVAYGHVSDILTPGRIGLLLGAALLAVIAAFGGWSAAGEAAEDTPMVRSGEPIGAAPLEITVHRAFALDSLETVLPAQQDTRYLSVSLEVENTSDRPVSSYLLNGSVALEAEGLETIELDGGPRPSPPQLLRAADGLAERSFQPGLTVEVVLVWKQSVSVPAPEELEVTFAQHSWRRSVMDDSYGWRDPAPAARVLLPVEELG